MYIHLLCYEPFTIATVALYVREFAEDGAGFDVVVRVGAAAVAVEGYAADHSASAVAGGRGVAGAAGRDVGDG